MLRVFSVTMFSQHRTQTTLIINCVWCLPIVGSCYYKEHEEDLEIFFPFNKDEKGSVHSCSRQNVLSLLSYRALSKHFFWHPFFIKDSVSWAEAITQRTSARWSLHLGVHMRRCKPPLWGPGAMPLEALTIPPISGFQIAFPCMIQWQGGQWFFKFKF